MPSLIPDDVRALGQVYGFSVEGYVNFEATRLRAHTLETTPLMQALERTPAPQAEEAAAQVASGTVREASAPADATQESTAKAVTP